ncbi:MAG: type II toxin-antitoxin system PemK/MazF family toxin [Clostridiales bacterium]|nr:type II toxin-antitoxin system PemK/MazF family toxin [Clostridiales bacterium]
MENLKRFDVVLVDFGSDAIGSEQGGIRPAVIIQNDDGNIHSSTTIVMPLTKKVKNLYQPTHSLLKKDQYNGLRVDSMLLGECLRQVSERRILKYLGYLNDVKEKKEVKRVYDANFGDEV